MIRDKSITVVLPAYNAGKTLESTYRNIPFDIVDQVILVDDKSNDNTVEVARDLGIQHVIEHQINRGYGGNQKTCYDRALALESDIVIMLHPDYQYDPRLIHSMAYLIAMGCTRWYSVHGSLARVPGKEACPTTSTWPTVSSHSCKISS